MRKLVALGLVVFVAACADAATEPAADLDPQFAGNGANVQVSRWVYDYCEPSPTNPTWCHDYQVVISEVTTKKGLKKYTIHTWGERDYYWLGQYSGTRSWNEIQSYVNLPGALPWEHQAYAWRDQWTWDLPDGTVLTCTEFYVFANGEVRRDVDCD
jgi:hypothetical protein